jgi:hypothetical protein
MGISGVGLGRLGALRATPLRADAFLAVMMDSFGWMVKFWQVALDFK